MEKPVLQPESSQSVSVNTSNKQNSSVTEPTEEGLLDFSAMFKKNGFIKRPAPKLGQNRKTQTSQPNWLLQIPAKLQITLKDLQQRRYLNEDKWKMVVKTSQQEKTTICALISCLHYIFKSNQSAFKGPLTLKDVQQKIIDEIKQKQLSRRQTVLECCQLIRKNYQIAELSTKIHEIKEEGQSKQFLNYIVENQSNSKKSFVYICHGQVLCPIGYENTPLVPLDAYKTLGEINPQKMEMWMIFASPSKTQAPLVIKRWTDVEKQMASRWPEYMELNEVKKGRQTWDEKNGQASLSARQVSCWIELTVE